MQHHDSATEAPPLGREEAEELEGRICAHAARQARDSCELLILIGDFDAGRGWAWSNGMKSVAHWLAWTCSMTPATAREHVRVARALRRMPTVTAAFGAGELSYSKVRELTRVVDLVDESRLCELARYATASQLARMITSFRAAAGTRIRAEGRRLFRLIPRDKDTMTGIAGRLPADESAVVAAALQRARDLNSGPPPAIDPDPDQHDATPPYTDADALLDLCRHYLATATGEDGSGEDRSLVIIEVAADQLQHPAGVDDPERTVVADGVDAQDRPAGAREQVGPASVEEGEGVPAGTSEQVGITSLVATDGTMTDGTRRPAGTVPVAGRPGVPAGTPRDTDRQAAEPTRSPLSQVCTIRGTGPIEPRTAQRVICTGSVVGAIVDRHGDVLALGRTRRLVSRRQRRALQIRDQLCQFPGCWRDRHLEAHHRIPWSHGGTTDLANLILLCRFHHTAVHEGGITIARHNDTDFPGARTGVSGWQFRLPDGEPVAETGWRVMTADHLIRTLSTELEHDPASIRTVGGGEGFNLHNCVEALFSMVRNQDQEAA